MAKQEFLDHFRVARNLFIHAPVEAREDRCELGLLQALGDERSQGEQAGGSPPSVRFGHQIVNRGPVAQKLRIQQDGGCLSEGPNGIRPARRPRMPTHCPDSPSRQAVRSRAITCTNIGHHGCHWA